MLNVESLHVETFATTAAPQPRADEAEKASGATSCPVRPPYCTC
jgi:hypothetical protein